MKSAIMGMDLSDFKELIQRSKSWKEVMIFFKKNHGYKSLSHKNAKKRAIEEGVDFSHFLKKGKAKTSTKRIPLSEILVEESYYHGVNLKKRLIKEGILENKCRNCNIGPEWNGKSLTLQLEHINGNSCDHRIENLEILCPNCHSQTSTYSGGNVHRYRPVDKKCKDCGKKISANASKCVICSIKSQKSKSCNNRYSKKCKDCDETITKKATRCLSCAAKESNNSRRKVQNRPTLKQLESDLEQMPMTKVGKKYGVSDNTIRKWIKSYI